MKALHIYSLGIAVVALLTSHHLSAWTAPNNNPPNAGGVAAPLHTGSANQVKTGSLGVDGLVVDGNAHVTNNLRVGNNILFNANTSGDYLGYQTQQGVTYYENGSPRWRLTGNGDNYINGGRLGIGTTNPSDLLHVAGTARANRIDIGNTRTNEEMNIRANTPYVYLDANDNSSAGIKYFEDGSERNGFMTRYNTGANRFEIRGRQNGSWSSGGIFINRTNGRVGVGVPSPDYPFHVDGVIKTNSDMAANRFCNANRSTCVSADDVLRYRCITKNYSKTDVIFSSGYDSASSRRSYCSARGGSYSGGLRRNPRGDNSFAIWECQFNRPITMCGRF